MGEFRVFFLVAILYSGIVLSWVALHNMSPLLPFSLNVQARLCPVIFVMRSVYLVEDLPRGVFPATMLSTVNLSRPVPRTTWPKNLAIFSAPIVLRLFFLVLFVEVLIHWFFFVSTRFSAFYTNRTFPGRQFSFCPLLWVTHRERLRRVSFWLPKRFHDFFICLLV